MWRGNQASSSEVLPRARTAGDRARHRRMTPLLSRRPAPTTIIPNSSSECLAAPTLSPTLAHGAQPPCGHNTAAPSRGRLGEMASAKAVTAAPREANAGQQGLVSSQDPQEREAALGGISRCPATHAADGQHGTGRDNHSRRPSGPCEEVCSVQGAWLTDTEQQTTFTPAAGRGPDGSLPTAGAQTAEPRRPTLAMAPR